MVRQVAALAGAGLLANAVAVVRLLSKVRGVTTRNSWFATKWTVGDQLLDVVWTRTPCKSLARAMSSPLRSVRPERTGVSANEQLEVNEVGSSYTNIDDLDDWYSRTSVVLSRAIRAGLPVAVDGDTASTSVRGLLDSVRANYSFDVKMVPPRYLSGRGQLIDVDFDDVPWATALLTVWMAAVYVVDPTITPLSYTLLAPWMHAGFGHIWQNLLVFVVLGVGVERRVGSVAFGAFAVLIPYLALYLPVALEYGGLSRGASGLTMSLTGYAVPVLIVGLAQRIESFELDAREVAVGLGMFLVLLYLIVDAWVTVRRFVGIEPRPDGVSVSSHLTGLVLGLLWFGWRGWRHGMSDEA